MESRTITKMSCKEKNSLLVLCFISGSALDWKSEDLTLNDESYTLYKSIHNFNET